MVGSVPVIQVLTGSEWNRQGSPSLCRGSGPAGSPESPVLRRRSCPSYGGRTRTGRTGTVRKTSTSPVGGGVLAKDGGKDVGSDRHFSFEPYSRPRGLVLNVLRPTPPSLGTPLRLYVDKNRNSSFELGLCVLYVVFINKNKNFPEFTSRTPDFVYEPTQ